MKPIPEMTREEINRELRERLKIKPAYDPNHLCPHCGYYCTGKHFDCLPPIPIYPDFYSDPLSLLKEMRKLNNYLFFLRSIFVAAPTAEECLSRSIIQPLLDEDGLFTIMALDWLRKERG